jgi:thioredoxin 1
MICSGLPEKPKYGSGNGPGGDVASIFLLCGLLLVSSPARVISRGEEVRLQSHLEAGKYTLVDFYADWCGPCRQLEPTLNQLVEQQGHQLALVKVDIVDWNTPVVRQHGIRFVPHLQLFSPAGEFLVGGNAYEVLARLNRELGVDVVELAGGGGSFFPFASLLWLGLVLVVALLLMTALAHYRSKTERLQELRHAETRLARYAADPRLKSEWSLMERPDEGPFSVEDLRSLLLSRRLDKETLVVRSSKSSSGKPMRLVDLLESL